MYLAVMFFLNKDAKNVLKIIVIGVELMQNVLNLLLLSKEHLPVQSVGNLIHHKHRIVGKEIIVHAHVSLYISNN